MTDSLLSQMKREYNSFSKSHKKIADYILTNYDKAAFMTAAKLGAATDISESTVVRFATHLGFEGYPEFQAALLENIKSKLTAAERMDVTISQMPKEDILQKVLSNDMSMIKTTFENVSHEDFDKSVKAINNAKKIYILGARSCTPLAHFIGFYFNLVYDNIQVVDSGNPTAMFEQIFKITKDDVCIAISFPRYSNQTLNTLSYAHGTGAKIIAITDNERSPIAGFADYILTAKSNMASFIDSLVAPLSLINALIVACTIEKRDDVASTFENLERIWEEYNVYAKTEQLDE